MADPLSAAASALTVVCFAGESCHLLFQFFRAVTGAPAEIQRNITTLQALSSTFEDIHRLGQRMPEELAWSNEFQARLRDCMADFHAMECKIGRLNERLEKGKMQRTWARLRWLSLDHHLHKFFVRVQTYHVTFSLDLLILHMKMDLPRPGPTEIALEDGAQPPLGMEKLPFRTNPGNSCPPDSLCLDSPCEGWPSLELTTSKIIHPVKESTGSPHALGCAQLRREYPRSFMQGTEETPHHLSLTNSVNLELSSALTAGTIDVPNLGRSNGMEFEIAHGSELTSSSPPHYSPHLLQYLQSRHEPVSVRSWKSRQWSLFSTKLHLSLGPVLLQRWNISQKSPQPLFQATKPHEGYGVVVVLTFSFGKATFILYFIRKTQHPHAAPSLSVQWNLSFPRQVRDDAQIMRLARAGDITAMKKLFQSGRASASDVTTGGKTLLHVAARTKNVSLVRFLVQSGADVNAPDEDGETPLHAAVSCASDYEVSRVLLESGADVMNRSVYGKTPLHTFFNAAVGAILQCHGDSVDWEVRDERGMTVMHFLAWSSKSDARFCRQYAERAGGSAVVWEMDNEGRLALHLAAQRGNMGMVEYLLRSTGTEELDVNAKDRYGRTAIFYAVESKRSKVVAMIAAKGGDVRGEDCGGRTALHHAAARGNLTAVEKLIALGSGRDVWKADREGMTPVELAHRRGATPVAKFLQDLQCSLRKEDVICDDRSRDCGGSVVEKLHISEGYSAEEATGPRFEPSQWVCSGVAGNLLFIVFTGLIWECIRASVRFTYQTALVGNRCSVPLASCGGA